MTDASKIDGLILNLQNIEADLLKLHEITFIDIFSSNTRDYLNRLIFYSTVGILIGALAISSPESFFGMKVSESYSYLIPYALCFAIFFYLIAFLTLALGDRVRWQAIYGQQIKSPFLVASELGKLADIIKVEAEDYGSEVMSDRQITDLGPLDNDGVPHIVKFQMKYFREKLTSITVLQVQIANRANQSMKYYSLFNCVFFFIPAIYSVSAIFITSGIVEVMH